MEMSYRFKMHATLKVVVLLAGSLALLILATALAMNLITDWRLAKIERDFSDKLQKIEAGNLKQESKLSQIKKLSESKGQNVAFVDAIAKAVVSINCQDNKNKNITYTASGVVFDDRGLVITNQHILLSSDGTLIKTCGLGFTESLVSPPKIKYLAKVVAVHKRNDLAILQINNLVQNNFKFTAISIEGTAAATKNLNLGDQVYIGGYPGIGSETFTLTGGVVSGRVGSNFIKTSALIDTGTSGGGAFDREGNFVGVATAAAKGEIGGSLGYFIDGGVVEKFINDYKSLK